MRILSGVLLGIACGSLSVFLVGVRPLSARLEATEQALIENVLEQDTLGYCYRQCVQEMKTDEWIRICLNVCREDVHGER